MRGGPRGMVEKFADGEVRGWVVGEAEDLPVEVELWLNDLRVASTWATDQSGANTGGAARGFRFAVRDLWNFVQRVDGISVRLRGEPLPIAGKGIYKRAANDGPDDDKTLEQLMQTGHVFDHTGRLQLVKTDDVSWQTSVFDLYDRSRSIVQEVLGTDLFVIYGTLLGQVREGTFIGHDNDFDAAFVSSASTGPEAAKDMHVLALALVEAGFDVECKYTALHIHDSAAPEKRIDIFHVYFDQEDHLQFPFGVSTNGTFDRASWGGTTEKTLADHPVLVPNAGEELLAHIYGPDWRVPVAGFNWDLSRKQQDKSGFIPREGREEVYWANFYAHTEFTTGSTFCSAVLDRSDLPTTILELGC
ncbi:MAG: hypothetical protein EOO27_44460, partial [Comamonadaceae bacterium]